MVSAKIIFPSCLFCFFKVSNSYGLHANLHFKDGAVLMLGLNLPVFSHDLRYLGPLGGSEEKERNIGEDKREK